MTKGKPKASEFKQNWMALNRKTKAALDQYLERLAPCDFTVFDFLINNIPDNSLLQLGNSTPVRYANLLAIKGERNLRINSNRGVSGIDGVLSTAAGASIIDATKLCFCITGDVAALYDSNALMNKHLGANFKLIIINNAGGNIFKIIPGPSKLDELEQYFETKHDYQFHHLAKQYDFAYFEVNEHKDLQQTFEAFVKENKKSAVLEIKTNNELSAASLKNYFNFINEAIELV